jgi:hypothetical protein
VKATLQGDSDGALTHLARFVNLERGIDGVEAYSSKFHDRPVHRSTLEGLLDRLKAIDPKAPEVEALQRQVGTLAASAV